VAREDLKYSVDDAHNLPEAAQIINSNFDLCDQHESLTPSSATKPHNISEVDETDTDTTKNKVVSNSLAKGWEDHKNSTVNSSTPHNIGQVDETDTDTVKNKLVSNALAKGWEDHKNTTSDNPHGVDLVELDDVNVQDPQQGDILYRGASQWEKLARGDQYEFLQVNEDGVPSWANDIVVKGPWIDVRAYGAAGDGVTDDTTAIQNAITEATTNGGIVFFPPGTYLYSSNITVSSHVILLGVEHNFGGWHGTNAYGSILKCTTDNVTITLEGYSEIRDLTFDTSGLGKIVTLNGPGVRIRGCLFLGKENAIYADNTDSNKYIELIENNTFDKQTSHCIYIENCDLSSPRWVIRRNRFRKQGTYNGAVLKVTGTGGLSISAFVGNVIDDFAEQDIYLVDFGTNGRDNFVVNNQFECGNVVGQTGVRVYGEGWQVVANSFDGLPTAIYLGDAIACQIGPNFFTNVTNRVSITASSTNNIIIANTTAGITATSNNLLIVGCILYGAYNGSWRKLIEWDHSNDLLNIGQSIVSFPQQSTVIGYLYNGGTNQSVSGGTWTKVRFDTTTVDRQSEFNTTDNRFTAKAAGIYRCEICVVLPSVTDQAKYEFSVYKNGSFYKDITRLRASGTGDITAIGSLTLELSPNDYIEVWCLFDYTADIEHTNTWFSITKIA